MESETICSGKITTCQNKRDSEYLCVGEDIVIILKAKEMFHGRWDCLYDEAMT